MDREKILKQAQVQSGGLDEREQQMLGLSFGFGAVAMTLLCVILAATELLQGGQAYDYAAIGFVSLAGTQARQAWQTRHPFSLVTAVACTVVLAVNLVLFLR